MATKDSAVFKVQADITDPQKKIAAMNDLVKKMAENVNTASSIGVKAFRSEAQAAEELLRKLGASDRQLGDLAKTTQRVEQAASAHLSRIGGAARTMASGFEAMARTGNVAGEATKQILASGSELAFTFGAAGPIVGAMGIGALAIINYFERTRAEMEATRKKFEDEVDAMVRKADNIGLVRKLQELELGDPAKGESRLVPGAFAGGLRDLQAQAAALRANPDALRSGASGAIGASLQGAGMGGIGSVLAGLGGGIAARRSLADLETQIAEMIRQRDELTRRILNPVALPRPVTGLAGVTITGSAGGGASGASAPDLSGLRGRATLGSVGGPDIVSPGGIPSALVDRILAAGGEGTFWDRIASGIRQADEAQLDFARNMTDVTQASVDSFAQASVNAFLLFAESGKLTGKGFGQAILTGVEQAAAGKAIFYLAEGFGALAMAALGHPGAPGAAALDFKAAGLMLAIAGGAGLAGGNAAGGNSRGGGGTRGASFNSGMASTFENRTPAEIKIVGGLLDTSDTRQMDALAEAFRALSGRNVVVVSA